MQSGPPQRNRLIHIVIIMVQVINNSSTTAGIDKLATTTLESRLKDIDSAVVINRFDLFPLPAVSAVSEISSRDNTGTVKDNIRAIVLKGSLYTVSGGNVSMEPADGTLPMLLLLLYGLFRRWSQIQNGNSPIRMLLEQSLDNVASQKSSAAGDEALDSTGSHGGEGQKMDNLT